MKMIKYFLSLLIASSIVSTALGQENTFTPKGNFYGKVYANFHTDIDDFSGEKAFEVARVYLGYKTSLSENFSGNIKLDIGSPGDVSEYSLKKRFAYFKSAYLQYKYNQLTLKFGLSDCYQFKVQEKFWGYRYIYKSFQDKHKFGSSADIGVFAEYKLSDIIHFDFSFVNGEGYGNIQNDESFKTTFGATVKPNKTLTIRAYGDFYQKDEIAQVSVAGFAGLKFSKFRIGGDYSFQVNNNFKEEQNLNGFSFYGTYNINSKLNVFARFDQLFSNILDGNTNPWNLVKDGSAIIGGVEYKPIDKIKISVNYQDWVPYAENADKSQWLFVNLEYAF
jgi:hypothetical protein